MKQFKFLAVAFVGVTVALVACEQTPTPKTTTTNYPASSIYVGSHASMTGSVKFTEDGNNTKLLVTLNNTLNATDYNLHVHDYADTATTPNNTPYNESPNVSILAGTIAGNGGTVTKEFTAMHSYDYLMDTYAGGYFVVHDPTQTLSTTDLTTYLIVGAFPN